jgi:hypothetical protein
MLEDSVKFTESNEYIVSLEKMLPIFCKYFIKPTLYSMLEGPGQNKALVKIA